VYAEEPQQGVKDDVCPAYHAPIDASGVEMESMMIWWKLLP
jgi:hypothetical protein